jgi:hypothetical protein
VTSPGEALAAWPALAGGEIPARLRYELGVWGKLPGSRADYKWIAATPSFAGQNRSLEKELQLGSEDVPRKATYWRSLGEAAFAMVCYPSASVDAGGRSSFLEKQVLSWRRPAEVPAAIGALALLPQVAQASASVWQGRRTQSWSEDDDSTLVLASESHGPLQVSAEALAATAAAGLDELGRTVREEALAELYAHLLAGYRAVPLSPGLEAPLGPAALAALLLPLPQRIADGLSLAGWLPSQRISDPGELRRCWDATLGGTTLPPLPTVVPASELREKGRALARAVLAKDPAPLQPRPVRPAAVQEGRRSIQLAMWGPSLAGKTALLAQLYLGDQEGDWEAKPAGKSQEFFDHMRTQILSNRFFPPASSQSAEQIELRFLHRRTGVEILLWLEDRAGSESESLTEPVRKHLAAADGLLLLFDPQMQGAKLHTQVWQALEHLGGARERNGKDDRPIAVCLSKADLLIRTLDDLRSAREDPNGFVRRNDRMQLARLLDRFCTNHHFFPVSAAGLRTRYGVVESVVFYDEALQPRLAPGGSPLNVMKPFAWLLDQVMSRT